MRPAEHELYQNYIQNDSFYSEMSLAQNPYGDGSAAVKINTAMIDCQLDQNLNLKAEVQC